MGSKFPTPAPTDPEHRKPPAPKGPPPMESVTSLQRELAEARAERDKWRAEFRKYFYNDDATIFIVSTELFKMACPEEMPPVAPAPSDVKGEEPAASDTKAAPERIESDTKLTPLNHPSVRGVLVDDGEPTKQIISGRLYRAIGDDYIFEADVEQGHVATYPLQPVTLRPASEFGVAGGERIKELEAELAKRTQERDEAVPFMAALKGRHNGYDPGNSKMYPNGPPATPEVALNELIEEQEWLVNSELQQAQSDAERLRKAIETHRLEWGAGRVIESNNRLWSALSPSPAAASGEKQTENVVGAGGAGLAYDLPNVEKTATAPVTTSAPSAESDKPYGLVEQMDAGEGTVYGRRVTVKRREYPAAETQGNAQHHSEGAKILDGGSGSSAAESEGGESRVVQFKELRDMLTEAYNQRDALSARLAACEERCRELEAGIEKHQRQHQAIYEELDGAEKFDRELWSLLAPKAGGEDAVV